MMIYECRVYEVAPGRMHELHRRFRDHTLRFFERHGIKPIAFFNSEIGELSDRLTYIVAFESLCHREKAWAAFHGDTEWREVLAASNAQGPLVLRLRSVILTPTDYSPMA